MRIALVASQSSSPRPRDATGPGQRVTSLAEALGRLGHQVTLYAPSGSPALPGKATLAPGVTVEHLSAGPGGQAGSGRESGDEPALDIPAFSDHLARRWRQDPPDIAHAHFWSSGLAALLPGITAGPWMLPPSSRSASVSRFKPLVCLAVLWQLKQRASSTGRTSLSNVDRSAAKRLAEAMNSTTTCHSIV